VVVDNYCRNADHFLCYLAEREIAVEAATPAEVSNYLRASVRWFRKRHGYSPRPHGSPFREHQFVRWCGACRNGGHLSLWHPIPARLSAEQYAANTGDG
jgi:integrase/recombinase XerD